MLHSLKNFVYDNWSAIIIAMIVVGGGFTVIGVLLVWRKLTRRKWRRLAQGTHYNRRPTRR